MAKERKTKGILWDLGLATREKDEATGKKLELEKRFPGWGTENDLYCFGQILHPFYRGSLLSKGSQKWKDRYFINYVNVQKYWFLYRYFR